MNITLKSSLEAEILDQIVIDVRSFLDRVDKLDADKSWGQLGIHPTVLKEFRGEVMGLLVKAANS